ncbi:hypothetical protein OIN60_01430 [Paenibacillus sp. P96]|uniref:TFIIB-type domain-containing protein n=1 Tax=Paenibacillus zeirhizosphaerae TaxID=2987519 RepID=A0ABT9FL47_9BACL|nr:hypothetical protein [Paenibacillus sp. P96]MDP4095453.1 hypothetical protein [Paenibacillus sp. P96]
MWQIRLYDHNHFWNEEYDKMPLVKEVESEPDYESILQIGEKTYKWRAKSPANKVFCVIEISINHDPEAEEFGDFKCPYCSSVDEDAWERKDDDTIECSGCGSVIEFERHIEVSYTVYPVKLAPIVNI